MTRPAGASFAQFFPAAPRAARDRATERERAKMKAHEFSSASPADINGHRTSLNSAASSSQQCDVAANGRDAAHSLTEDAESLAGDTLNTGGSASSHDSTSSSVFSAPARPSNSDALRSSTSHLTPPTTLASPSSNLSATARVKAQSTTPRRVDGTDGRSPMPNGFVHQAQAARRSMPARDPSRSIQALRCRYDPLLDTSASNPDKKKGKPVYKEFGLVRSHVILLHRGGSVILDHELTG